MARRSRGTEENFSLFPFLAVLLCTMGTLALIFVLVAQQDTSAAGPSDATEEELVSDDGFDASVAVDESASGKIVDAQTLDESLPSEEVMQTRPIEDLRDETESLEWLLGELGSIREQTETALEEERARLANAEAGLAKLRDELEVARRKFETLVASNGAEEGDESQLRERVETLDAEIAELERVANELREKNANAKRSYAIVPYQGKKGTFRRPIFIECKADGVYLQPENVRFDDADFLLAPYPGNPFDSALRVVSQRMVARDGGKTKNGETVEPYPLVIVRPSGANYFYATVAALASWGELYGYEFVEEDRELEFPASDPELAKLASDQASFARSRLGAQLAEAIERRRMEIARNARPASRGDFGSDVESKAPATPLQARLGANARVGAAKPNAGSSAFAAAPRPNPTVVGSPPVVGSRPNPSSNVSKTFANASIGASSKTDASSTPLPAYTGRYSQYKRASGTEPGASLTESVVSPGRLGAPPVGTFEELRRPPSAADGVASSSDASLSPSSAFASTTSFVPNASSPGRERVPSPPAANDGTAPGYMKNFIADSNASPIAATSQVGAEQTLGNTTFDKNSRGSSLEGEIASSRESEKPREEKSPNPPGAFSVSEELSRPATSGNERGIVVRCERDAVVFPRQPGFRSDVRVAYDPTLSVETFEKRLEDAITLCVKTWGGAGRNHYWAPFLRATSGADADATYAALSTFCARQGLGIVKTDETSR